MTDLPIAVPHFARLVDYFDIWLIEPTRASRLWEAAVRLDMARHFAIAAEGEPKQLAFERVKSSGQTVAVIPLEGMLMKHPPSLEGTSTVQARREIRKAVQDEDVGAILLMVDSPGGTAAGAADLAAEVHKARLQKPLWAFVEDMAASAAYWAASQAEKVFANSPSAMVGSIGTYLTVYDQSAQAEKEGVRTLVFSTGPLKGAGVPGAPVTDLQAAHFQALVDGLQAQFDRGVRLGRSLTSEQMEPYRAGGVHLAAKVMADDKAKDRKLIDGVRSLDRTLEELAKEAGGRARPRATAAAPSRTAQGATHAI